MIVTSMPGTSFKVVNCHIGLFLDCIFIFNNVSTGSTLAKKNEIHISFDRKSEIKKYMYFGNDPIFLKIDILVPLATPTAYFMYHIRIQLYILQVNKNWHAIL